MAAIDAVFEVGRPDADTRQASSRLEHAVTSAQHRPVLVVDGEEVEVPEGALRVLLHTVHQQAAGRRVRVVTPDSDEELTPNQAAAYVGVSRPLLVKLMDDGRIPFRTLPGSRHRRIAVVDLETYLDRRVRRRGLLSKAMNEVKDDGLYFPQD